jgi:hypothetical protein
MTWAIVSKTTCISLHILDFDHLIWSNLPTQSNFYQDMDDFHNLCGKGHHSMMKVIVR